jgi:hypothetical protein
MSDLQTLANLAEVIGGVFLVGGIVFAVIQIRQLQRQRQEAAAIELIRAWHGPEFSRAIHRLLVELPDGMPVADLLAAPEHTLPDAHMVCNVFESVGVMVFRRMLPLDVADELIGGVTMGLWRKLAPWILHTRATQHPRAYEWFEWLNDRISETARDSDVPASELHKNWQR